MLQDHVSICKVDEVDKISIDYDCIDVVEETLSKIKVPDYTTRQLLEHKRIWDVVTANKEGYDKEHLFSDWRRRVARHSTATEHVDDNVTRVLGKNAEVDNTEIFEQNFEEIKDDTASGSEKEEDD